MKTNFDAMMTTAAAKYTELIDIAYCLKNGSQADCDKLIKLIHSMYMDEANLIFELCVNTHTEKEEDKKKLQIPGFMCKK